MALETTLCVTAGILVAVYLYISRQKYRHIPAAPYRIPLLGNAWNLDMTKCHIVLSEWANKLGPVFRIRLYNEEILVLNDYDSICEALLRRGSDVAGRPAMYRTVQSGRNKHSIVWQTYTPKLAFLRKEVLKSLKMYGSGLERLEEKCAPEIEQMLKEFSDTNGQPFDPWDSIYNTVCNVMLNLVLGITMEPTSVNFQKLKTMNFLFNDTFGTGRARRIDLLPWTRFFYDECYQRLQQAMAIRDKFWREQLSALKENDRDDCIVKRLMKLLEDDKCKQYDISETTVKEVFTNLILAGTDTTATALSSLLLLFLHYPEVQERMYDEIQANIGLSRTVSLSDKPNMPYCEATLLELLRLISHVPLAVPHYTLRDTEIAGYKIPANMTVYINLWAMHHDSFWSEPWRFNPARFLDEEGKLLSSCHETRRRLMAFGSGRRICLGETLAKNRLFLFAVSLVQRFRVIPESGKLPDADPRTFEMGLVVHPKHYKLSAVPRRS